MTDNERNIEDKDFKVEIVLSRPSYRLGGTVVGTVRVVAVSSSSSSSSEGGENPTTASTEDNDIRECLESLELILVGRCRLDPRWHNIRQYEQLLWSHKLKQHPLVRSFDNKAPTTTTTTKTKDNNSSNDIRSAANATTSTAASSTSSYCFWRTECMNLLELRERPNGRWDDVKPKPMYIPGMTKMTNREEEDDEGEEIMSSESTSSSSPSDDGETTESASPSSPPPLLLEEEQSHRDGEEGQEETPTTKRETATDDEHAPAHQRSLLEKQQLAFTFRVDLPTNIPHSMSGSSCRYYYNVGVRLRRKRSSSRRRMQTTTATASKNNSRFLQQWYQVPFVVHTPDPDINIALGQRQQEEEKEESAAAAAAEGSSSSSSSSFQFHTITTPCLAIAHSSGLPCAVTAVELARPGGQLAVNRHGPCLYRHIGLGVHKQQQYLQTMRVANPSGEPVCVLTMLGGGASAPMCPGSRIILKLDFPATSAAASTNDADGSRDDGWVPCYQVCACLEGEEWALRPTTGGGGSSGGNTKKTKARTFLFDTAHERIDPDTTERVCLHMMLPLDAPCSIETQFVSIKIRCIVDISVLNNNNKIGKGRTGRHQYQNLRLEVPIQVMHGLATYERKEDDDYDTRQIPTLDELLGYDDNDDEGATIKFPTKDITDELKILSLHMADECGLITR